MNAKQRNIMYGGIGAVVLMGLFPPFNDLTGYGPNQRVSSFGGYHFVQSSPEDYQEPNIPLLLVQWVGVGLVGGGLSMAARDRFTPRRF